MTVEAIKEAISELGADEKTSLAAWLIEQDAAEWDRQMEEDFSPGGAGMALFEEAKAELHAGRVKPMDEFLAEARQGTKPQDPRL